MATADPAGLRAERERRLQQLREAGINPYATGYARTHTAAQLQELFRELPAGTETDTVVRVCGRIMNERGTWMFIDLFDESGRIQLFCHKDSLSQELLRRLRLLHRGDFIGCEGTIRRTHRGELSVRITAYEILSTAVANLPGSYDGFVDPETRRRLRHLDLIMNRAGMETLRRRSLTIRYLRQFLDSEGFLECETPVLQAQPGGAHARPFVTHHNALDIDLHLRIATELHLKRLIIGGFERVYEIGRVFRNEGMSSRHSPEFTSLELYQAYGDYNELMDFTERMLRETVVRVTGSAQVNYQQVALDFGSPFRRVTMADAIREVTGLDVSTLADDAQARAAAAELGVVVAAQSRRGDVINAIFEAKVEATLIQPTFVIDYPVEVSPLARAHRSVPGLVERFELFVFGRELGNGYSELIDPIDQRARLEEQARRRQNGDHEAEPLDLEFVAALEYGMPPTMGVGIGIDRLVMFLTDAASIGDVIAFPLLRPTRETSEEG